MADQIPPGTDDDLDERVRQQKRRFFGALAFACALLGIWLVIFGPYLTRISHERNEILPPEVYILAGKNELQADKPARVTRTPAPDERSGRWPIDNLGASRFNTLGNGTVSITSTLPDLSSHMMPYVRNQIWSQSLAQAYWSGIPVEVSAGALAGKVNPAQGVVTLTIHSEDRSRNMPDWRPTPVVILWSPVRTGSLRIADLDHHRLTLLSEDGSEFVLDLQTWQWVSLLLFLPHDYAMGSKSKSETGQMTLLPLQPTKLRAATRGMILDYPLTGLPEIHDQIVNQWYDTDPTSPVRAYAGHAKNDASQGLLIVEEYPEKSASPKVSYYFTPRRAGPARIKDVVNQLMTLEPEQSTGSRPFYFDLSSRRWVGPPPTPSPTRSPTPVPTFVDPHKPQPHVLAP